MVEALERIGLPAAVLHRDGRVLARNEGLQKLDRQFLIGARDALVLANPAANELFMQSLGRLTISRNVGPVMSFPVPADETHPAQIAHLVPIKGAANDVFSRAMGILVVTPLATPRAPSKEVLNGLFDLTPAEARVAQAVIEGKTVNALADELGLSPGTLRQQLKSVLTKTGTKRQADLVGLLAASGIPYRSKDNSPIESK